MDYIGNLFETARLAAMVFSEYNGSKEGAEGLRRRGVQNVGGGLAGVMEYHTVNRCTLNIFNLTISIMSSCLFPIMIPMLFSNSKSQTLCRGYG